MSKGLLVIFLSMPVVIFSSNVSGNVVATSGSNFRPFLCSADNGTFSACISLPCCICYNSTSELKELAAVSEFSPFFLLSLALVLLVVPVLIFFNLNISSGPKQSLIFFYQCLPLATPFGKITALVTLQNQLYSFHSNSLLFKFPPLASPLYVQEYCKHFIIAAVITLALVLVKCTWCPMKRCLLPWAKVRRAARNVREKCRPNKPLLKGVCSVVVLAYGNLVSISCIIIGEGVSACCHQTSHPRADRCFSLPSFAESYTWYMAVASAILFLLLPLPLSLIYYPSIPALFHKLTKRSLPRFPKLDPVFDVFQGVYKDNMRWFAGVHFLYHYLLWLIHAYTFNSFRGHFFLMCALALITTIQSILRPFKKASHNYVQTLFLLSFVLQSIFSLFLSCSSHDIAVFSLMNDDQPVLFATTLVWLWLGIIPLLAIIVFYVRKYCLRRFRLEQSERVANFVSKYLKGWKRKNNAELTNSLQDDLLVVDRHALSFESVASSTLAET